MNLLTKFQLGIVAIAFFGLANPASAYTPAPVRQPNIKPVVKQPIEIAKSKSNQSKWKPFNAIAENFSILLPGTPIQEKSKAPDGNKFYTLKAEDKNNLFLLSYVEMDRAIPSSFQQFWLDSALENFLNSGGFTLLKKKDISLNRYHGLEFDFLYKNTLASKGQMYLVDNRLYILVTTTQDKNAQKFLNSFRLLSNTGKIRS